MKILLCGICALRCENLILYRFDILTFEYNNNLFAMDIDFFFNNDSIPDENIKKKVIDLSSLNTNEDLQNFANEFLEHLLGTISSISKMQDYLTKLIYIDDYRKDDIEKVFCFANNSPKHSPDITHLANVLQDSLIHKKQSAKDLLKDLVEIKLMVSNLQERLTRAKQLSNDRLESTTKINQLFENLQEHLASTELFSEDFQECIIQDKQLFVEFRNCFAQEEQFQDDIIQMEFSFDGFIDFITKIEHSSIDMPEEWIKAKKIVDDMQENITQEKQLNSNLKENMMVIKDLANNLGDNLKTAKQAFDGVLNHIMESLRGIGNLGDYLKYMKYSSNKDNTIN